MDIYFNSVISSCDVYLLVKLLVQLVFLWILQGIRHGDAAPGIGGELSARDPAEAAGLHHARAMHQRVYGAGNIEKRFFSFIALTVLFDIISLRVCPPAASRF